MFKCLGGEIGKHNGLKIRRPWPYRFKSGSRHHGPVAQLVRAADSFRITRYRDLWSPKA